MPPDAESYRDLNDQALLGQCRWDAFRGPGPGGQKRNKTSNSMRLTHAPTGIRVLAGESRSQSENKERALRRLKLRLAIDFRRPIDPRIWEPPPWIDQIRTRPSKDSPAGTGMRLQISHRHLLYFHFVGLLLDLIEARGGHISDAAGLLSLSTSSVIKFLANDPHIWTAANQIRAKHGEAPLKRP